MSVRLVPAKRPVADQVIDRFVDNLEQRIEAISNADAITSLRQIFLAKRLASASALEELRLKATGLLMAQVEEMHRQKRPINPAVIAAIVKTLSDVGAADLAVATGNSPTAGGISLYNVVNNRNSSAAVAMSGSTASPIGGDKATSSTIQDVGTLLEAITSIADGIKRNPTLIDGQAKSLDPSDNDPSKPR